MADVTSLDAAQRDAARDRPGHAPRRTADTIAEAAYDLLMTGGVNAFSLRAVAKRAKLRLASVQYHYPSLRSLAEAIIALNRKRYREAYERVAAPPRAAARDRLRSVIEYNLQDIQSSDTRRFFVHFWSLLESIDGYSGDLLAELYEAQFEMLAERISEVHPGVTSVEARTRAELIGALIEGMFITLPRLDSRTRSSGLTHSQGLDLCLAIADGKCMNENSMPKKRSTPDAHGPKHRRP